MLYKAFISYSHAADGKLAPAIQSALHRIAKPFYRIRALRVFRDKTSLSADPALWRSIEEALAESEYFLLMASPMAAQSPWVKQEVEWWLKNRSIEKMLILLTEGDIFWNENARDFDWSRTNSLPENLREQFREVPNYIDLRWAKSEASLSLRHPQFHDASVTVAAKLHGKRKDDLAGEDVRQHRITTWVSVGAIAAILVFAGTATWQAIEAYQQRNAAEERRQIAEYQEKRAVKERNLKSNGRSRWRVN